MTKAVLLQLKKRQARREERGLVIPNERRTTRHGAFSAVTRRPGRMTLVIENAPYFLKPKRLPSAMIEELVE